MKVHAGKSEIPHDVIAIGVQVLASLPKNTKAEAVVTAMYRAMLAVDTVPLLRIGKDGRLKATSKKVPRPR